MVSHRSVDRVSQSDDTHIGGNWVIRLTCNGDLFETP